MNESKGIRRPLHSSLLLWLFLGVFAVIFLIPFLYAIYTSFIEQQYVDTIAPLSGFTLDNYRAVFSVNVGRWLFNSAFVAFTVLIGNLIVNTMAAFALAKIRFRGRTAIFFIIIAMMMVPYQIVIIPLYLMLLDLNWLNTYMALIVPFFFQGFLVFLMRQFFMSFPDDLLEAARIDGLSTAGAFLRIVLPNSKIAIATQCIFSFAGTWNFMTWGQTFINDPNLYILPVGLNTLKNRYYTIPGYTMAGVVVMTIPILIIFFMMQKHFVQGIVTTGTKE